MSKNPDFTKLIFKDVTFSWPRLDQTYRFNQHKKESEPCAPTAQNAAWSIAWEMTPEKAQAFKEAMSAHYASCRSRNHSLPEFSGVFGLKEKDGVITVTARKNGVNRDGEVNDPPHVIDASYADLDNKAIWGGSEGHVRVLAYPSTNPQDGSGGISLLLNAVVVTDAKYGGHGFEDDFGEPAERPAFPDDDGGYYRSENPAHGMEDIGF